MLKVEEISAGIDTPAETVVGGVARLLGVLPDAVLRFEIVNRSVDSRKKNHARFIYILHLEIRDEENILKALPDEVIARHRIATVAPYHYEITACTAPRQHPVIAGSGPCGLFAALLLARAGLQPVILERGKQVQERVTDVEQFFRKGILDPVSNVQFGEGGAGTFSDGKLYTLVNDPRSNFIFRELVRFGAPESILYDGKPHIGTDRLRVLLVNLRQELLSLGAEFRFGCKLTGLHTSGNQLQALQLENGERLPATTLILAIGHSARDTLAMLHEKGLAMQQKPFSMGVRIEHPRTFIDQIQYGTQAGHPALGAARYKMAVHLPKGRSVYTFCMCPGGYVVAAASETHGVVTNGMSDYARDHFNSNSALLVNISPSDFGSGHPLAGVAWQRQWEKKAYAVAGGGYIAPAQTVEDFLKNRPSVGFHEVKPTYRPGVKAANLAHCLPPYVAATLREALPLFERKFRGFALPAAVLTGVETRSSCPVRMLRDEQYQSNIRGVYPAGEGAGYAGGIVSSALDGLRVAEAVIGACRSGER